MMKKVHMADAVFVLTTMIVCSSLLTTMAAVSLFPEMMATPYPVHVNNNDCPLFCTDAQMHQPICGSNGTSNTSYENDCFMKILNCRYNTNFTKIHEGPCKTSSNTINETTDGVSTAPDNSFQGTTSNMDVPSSQTSSYGFTANNSSSTNSYEVYENVEENAGKEANSTPGTPETTSTSTDSLKSFANLDVMNSTTGTTTRTTQEFSKFEGDSSTTTPTPVMKDLNNSTRNTLDLEVTNKDFENESESTSEITFHKSSSTVNSMGELKSDDNVQQSTTVGTASTHNTGT